MFAHDFEGNFAELEFMPAGLEGRRFYEPGNNPKEAEIARRIERLFDLRPASIVERFGLKNPIFEATASYGHFGNRPYRREGTQFDHGREVTIEIEFFGGEKLDEVENLRREFGIL